MLVLVDSSYYIRRLSRKLRPFDELDEYADDYEFAVCGIIWLEVLRGRADPGVREALDARFSSMVFLDLTPASWQRTAALAWDLDRRGVVLPATDLVIAGCAIAHDAVVLTFDRHFHQIPGVSAVDQLV
ncbi:MAG: twitching motility protein PilT [Verrucomicrobia bacterium RIFCSPLOWO2_12_FULL_64_8]|nr:MAG: twitching motility protein PilT [Verrucomicrobia bacterium RIFCSPLOWO2_12_FULL_64_8]